MSIESRLRNLEQVSSKDKMDDPEYREYLGHIFDVFRRCNEFIEMQYEIVYNRQSGDPARIQLNEELAERATQVLIAYCEDKGEHDAAEYARENM